MGGCGEALERVEGEYHNQDILYKRNLFLTKEKGKNIIGQQTSIIH